MTDRTLLFHLSDIHFGLEDNRSLDWVAGEIAARKPAAVIITGDLTMRARTREFAAARNWILALDAPVTVEVGNLDLPYFNLFERFFDPYRRFHGMESVVEKELELPGIAVIPLMVDGERSEAASRLTFSLDTLDCDMLEPADER